MTLFLIFPVLWLVFTAFKPNPEVITVRPQLIPSRVTLENFRTFFRRGDFGVYLWNSVYVATGTAVLATGISALAAYSVTRLEYRGKGVVGYVILVIYMFLPILLAIPLFLFFGRLRLNDTYTGLVLAHTAYSLPFCLWLLRDFFETVPRSLDEAARIDGASAWRAVRSVTLPVVISNLVSVSTTDWGMVVAATTVVTIPPLLAVLFLQRYLLRGFGVAGA